MNRQKYAWLVVLLLALVWMLNYLDRQAIFSLFPLLQRSLRLSDFEEGLLGTVFLWSYACFSPFCGYLADRYGYKRLIVLSLLIWSAVTWLTGCAQNVTQMLVARGVMGLSEACYLPAGLGMIAACHGESTRSRATGIHYSGGYVGTVMGGVLGGWMGERYGWRWTFLILGAIGIVYAGALAVTLREQGKPRVRQEKAPLLPSLKRLFAARGYWIVFLVFGFVSVGDWAIYTWMPLYVYQHFQLSLVKAGWAATFYMRAGCFGGVFLGGWVADLWSRRTARGRVFTQCTGLLCASPFLIFAGAAHSVGWLVFALLVFGTGKGMYDCNVMPVLCELVPMRLRSTGFGVLNFVGPVLGGIAAAVAGILKSRSGLGSIFSFAGALALGSGFLLLLVRPSRMMIAQFESGEE